MMSKCLFLSLSQDCVSQGMEEGREGPTSSLFYSTCLVSLAACRISFLFSLLSSVVSLLCPLASCLLTLLNYLSSALLPLASRLMSLLSCFVSLKSCLVSLASLLLLIFLFFVHGLIRDSGNMSSEDTRENRRECEQWPSRFRGMQL